MNLRRSEGDDSCGGAAATRHLLHDMDVALAANGETLSTGVDGGVGGRSAATAACGVRHRQRVSAVLLRCVLVVSQVLRARAEIVRRRRNVQLVRVVVARRRQRHRAEHRPIRRQLILLPPTGNVRRRRRSGRVVGHLVDQRPVPFRVGRPFRIFFVYRQSRRR